MVPLVAAVGSGRAEIAVGVEQEATAAIKDRKSVV